MPELPEVETVMRGLEPALLNAEIKSAQTRRKDLRIPFPKNLKTVLEGNRVIRLHRRAKYILITFKTGDVLVIHLGMSGRVFITDDKGYQYQKHDHFIIETYAGTQIIYNDTRRFGMIFLVKETDIESHSSFRGLGPEPLGNDFNAPALKERLKGKKSSIKQALLDQRVVAGLGNIYVCEALYGAGISPTVVAGSISLPRLEKLVPEIKKVLKRAIKAGGSTLKDYRHADGELGYFQHSFKVYDQEETICPKCIKNGYNSACVRRIVQSGRSTFYCRRTQKR
ncbi:MAG: bifunctional DNA-formamidopyrimidine glycosylase/DNA-(apurinic or apyrimidinic site) lyase [Pseudomonadota bacterium]